MKIFNILIFIFIIYKNISDTRKKTYINIEIISIIIITFIIKKVLKIFTKIIIIIRIHKNTFTIIRIYITDILIFIIIFIKISIIISLIFYIIIKITRIFICKIIKISIIFITIFLNF